MDCRLSSSLDLFLEDRSPAEYRLRFPCPAQPACPLTIFSNRNPCGTTTYPDPSGSTGTRPAAHRPPVSAEQVQDQLDWRPEPGPRSRTVRETSVQQHGVVRVLRRVDQAVQVRQLVRARTVDRSNHPCRCRRFSAGGPPRCGRGSTYTLQERPGFLVP